jgi:hypothetical protein
MCLLEKAQFKKISWQKGIKSAKDKIKAHMIEIRLYQDDLVVVATAVLKVLARNVVYLGLNFGPILPLAVPFMVLTAQLVVSYAYDPLPMHERGAVVMSGRGTLLEIELAPGADVRELRVTLPDGLQAVSPLVRVPGDARAFQEFVAVAPGAHEVVLELAGVRETKLVYAGSEVPAAMQPRRVSDRDAFAIADTNHPRWKDFVTWLMDKKRTPQEELILRYILSGGPGFTWLNVYSHSMQEQTEALFRRWLQGHGNPRQIPNLSDRPIGNSRG